MTAFKVNVRPETRDAFRRLTREHDMTATAAFSRALVLLLEELCEPVPAATRRDAAQPRKHRPPTRAPGSED